MSTYFRRMDGLLYFRERKLIVSNNGSVFSSHSHTSNHGNSLKLRKDLKTLK